MMSQQSPVVLDLTLTGSADFSKQYQLAQKVLALKGVVPVLKVAGAGATTSLIKQGVNLAIVSLELCSCLNL
jgi:hypothetical protein